MAAVFKSVKEIDYGKTTWIDTRFNLQDVQEGKRNYAKSHVSGAIYWDLEEALSDMTKQEGRHPLPDKEKLTELFRKSGLNLNDNIIVYDDGGSPFAARAWWLLQYAGFKQSFIALEGFEALKEASVPVDDWVPKPVPSAVTPQWDETIYASRQYVEQTVEGQTASHLLDARSAERYRGEQEPIDPIAGRIPGALNFDWEQLKREDAYRLDDVVRSELNQVVTSDEEVTVYCGSGVTAAPLYAMLKHHGYDKVRLYVGSYSDWISMEGAEVERGDSKNS